MYGWRNDNFTVALQEPVAFWGGVFAGFLALDVEEEPLKGWIARTSADAGVCTQRLLCCAHKLLMCDCASNRL